MFWLEHNKVFQAVWGLVDFTYSFYTLFMHRHARGVLKKIDAIRTLRKLKIETIFSASTNTNITYVRYNQFKIYNYSLR